jgi:hypothetical protein
MFVKPDFRVILKHRKTQSHASLLLTSKADLGVALTAPSPEIIGKEKSFNGKKLLHVRLKSQIALGDKEQEERRTQRKMNAVHRK